MSDQVGIGKELDGLAWLDLSALLADFDQAIRFHQRRKQPGALARKLHRFVETVFGLAQAGPHIFAPAWLFPVGEGGAHGR